MKAPMLQIGGGKPSGPVTQIRATLEKVALRATELGREAVAIEAVKALQKIAGVEVSNLTISDCTFTAK